MKIAEQLEAIAKRRGFFWPTAEIYGGFAGFWDYGPLGAAMKRKLENLWRKHFLALEPNFFEIEPSHIMPEQVFVASGHIEHFIDPTVKCKSCGTLHRADHIMEEFLGKSFEGKTASELGELIKKYNVRCSRCGGELTGVGTLHMMFPLEIGAAGEVRCYLRPETAQAAYINFLRAFEFGRKSLPLGLAVIGRVYRNEISPRQLLIRMREFSQAELQIFLDPLELDSYSRWDEIKSYKLLVCPVADRVRGAAEMSCEMAASELKLPKSYIGWMVAVQRFFLEQLGIPADRFRFKELSAEERAFYNKLHFDAEIALNSFGWKEVAGVHYRSDWDLSGHARISRVSQSVYWGGKHIVPHVIEITFGLDRLIWSLLDLGYSFNKRTVLRLLPALAPYQVAVFPLVRRDGLEETARQIHKTLSREFDIIYDESDSIGRRYARVDEIGCPYSITVDYETLRDQTVTLRDRDSTAQVRVPIAGLSQILSRLIAQELAFSAAGKPVK